MSAATTREGIEVAMQEAAVVLVPCPSCGRSVPESNMGLHLAAGCGGGGGGEAGTDRRSRSVSAVSSPLPTAPPLERNGVPDPPRLARAEPHRSASLPSALRRRRGRSDAGGGSSNLDASDVTGSSWATSSDGLTTTAANRCPSETSGRTSSTSSSTTFRSSQGSLPPFEEEEGGEAAPSSRDVVVLCAADDGNDESGADNNGGGAEAVAVEGTEWACPRCTLLNSLGDGSCAACGHWNVAGVGGGAGGGGGDGVRAADPTRTAERLLDDDDFGFGSPLPEPITLNDYVRTIRSSLAVDHANADRDRLERQRRQQPAPPPLPSATSPTRMASGGALLGATLGAANAYVRGRPTGIAAFEGAVSGAVGGALVGEVLRDVLPPSPPRHTAEEGATTAAAAAEVASLEQSRTGPATGQPGYPTPEDATTTAAPRQRERPTPRRSVRVVRRPGGRGGYVTSTTTTTFEDFATTGGLTPVARRRNEFATSEEMLETLLGSIAMSPHGFHENNVPGHARLPLLSGRRIEDMSYEQLLDAFGDGSENRARGADASIVENLPVATLEDVERELPEGARSCAICLEDFQNGDRRRTLPCLHGFHADCVDRWLRGDGCCPVCKHAVG